MTRAKKATEETKKAQIQEYLDLKLLEEQAKEYARTEKEIIEATRENVIIHRNDLKQWGENINIEEVIEEEKEKFFYVTIDKAIYKVGLPKTEFIAYLDFEMMLNQTNLLMKPGETETLSVTLEPNKELENPLIWTSSNEEVATVSDGKVTAIKDGTTVIRVYYSGYASYYCECMVEVGALEFGVFKYANNNGKTLNDLGFTWDFGTKYDKQHLLVGKMGIGASSGSGDASATFTVAYDNLRGLCQDDYKSIHTDFGFWGETETTVEVKWKGTVVVTFDDGSKSSDSCSKSEFVSRGNPQMHYEAVDIPFNGRKPKTVQFITSGFDPNYGGFTTWVSEITLCKREKN